MYSVSSSACSSVGPLTGGEAAGGGGPSHAGLAWVARGGGRDRLPREGGARCDEGSLEASTGFDMAAVGLPLRWLRRWLRRWMRRWMRMGRGPNY